MKKLSIILFITLTLSGTFFLKIAIPAYADGTCSSGTPEGSAEACTTACGADKCTADSTGVKQCCSECPGGVDILGVCLQTGQKASVYIPILGYVSTDISDFAQKVLQFGYGIGTMIAILFLIIGGFGVTTSAGDPEKLEKAKMQITSAVEGLLFILLSVTILHIIGVDIIGVGSSFPF